MESNVMQDHLADLEKLDELTRKHEQLEKEAFEEARVLNTNRFGRLDEIAMNEARAVYLLGKERISLRFLQFESEAATRQLVEMATANAIEAKLNSRVIAKKIQRIEVMVVSIFAVVVGGYISTYF